MKPIAMKCTQKQFDAIEPKLEQIEGLKFRDSWDFFRTSPYLTNNFAENELYICNTVINEAHKYGRTVFEKWDEQIFLEYCGYKPKVTLDDAYVVECKTKTQSDEVASYIKDNYCEDYAFRFIINHKGLLNPNSKDNNLWDCIPDKAAHLPVLTFQEWKELKENQPMTKQKLTVPVIDVLEIHKIACSSWKSKIANDFFKRTDSDANITFYQTEVDAMFKAATPEQLPVLERIFGKKTKEIDWNKIKTGSKVMIEHTGQHCNGIYEIDIKKPVDVVFYKTEHCIPSTGVFGKNAKRQMVTFHQDGKYILFAADQNTDYITEVIEY